MAEQPLVEQRKHDLSMYVFSISAAMVGVCLTAIGILKVMTAQSHIETIADELLSADSVLFMLCCFLCFWSFKTRRERLRHLLRVVIDGLFILGLSTMVIVCAVMVYAIA
jgi:uncharacterized membrane protein